TCRLYHSRTGGTTMKTDASLARLEGLVPVRDEELVLEAQTPASLELLHRIVATPLPPASARRAPRRRVRVALPALAVARAARALAVTFGGGGHGTESAAAATLRKAANVARTQTQLVPGPGQYLYTKSVDAYVDTTVPAGGAGTEYNVLVPHVRETWLGP